MARRHNSHPSFYYGYSSTVGVIFIVTIITQEIFGLPLHLKTNKWGEEKKQNQERGTCQQSQQQEKTGKKKQINIQVEIVS